MYSEPAASIVSQGMKRSAESPVVVQDAAEHVGQRQRPEAAAVDDLLRL